MNDVAQDFGIWAGNLGDLRDELLNVLIVILVMAVLVLVIVQVLKSIFRVSVIACTMALWMNSLKQRQKFTEEVMLQHDFLDIIMLFVFPFARSQRPFKFRLLAYAQSRPLLMRQIENVCRTALENKSENKELARLTTAGASESDLVAYRMFEEDSIQDSEEHSNQVSKDPIDIKHSDLVAARLAAALEANLDDLQLRL